MHGYSIHQRRAERNVYEACNCFFNHYFYYCMAALSDDSLDLKHITTLTKPAETSGPKLTADKLVALMLY